MKLLLSHPVLIWSFRILIAGLFILAAMGKIANPHEFAQVIRKFHVLPRSLSNLTAITLPWVEMLAAFSLFYKPLRRGGILWIGGLLVGFTLLFFWVMSQGYVIDCGCFGRLDRFVKLLAGDIGLKSILRNLVLIAGCALLWNDAIKTRRLR